MRKADLFSEIIGKYKDTDLDNETIELLNKLKQKKQKLKQNKEELKQYKNKRLKILLGIKEDE